MAGDGGWGAGAGRAAAGGAEPAARRGLLRVGGASRRGGYGSARVVAVIFLGCVASFYATASIFSYGGYLCRDMGWSTAVDTAGFCTGWLASAVVGGRAITAPGWGAFADRFGRRSAVLATLAAVVTGNLLFMLSRHLVAAVLCRAVFLGALNGWNVLYPTLIGDLFPPSMQPKIFGYSEAAGGAVRLIGPGVSGLLYARGVWVPAGLGLPALPGLLPGAASATVASVAFCVAVLWLPEPESVVTSRPTAVGAPATDTVCGACRGSYLPRLCVLKALLGLHDFWWMETVPLLAIASTGSGGFGFSPAQLGAVYTIEAAASIPVGVCLVPRFIAAAGLRRAGVYAAGATAAAAVALPLSPALFPGRGDLQWAWAVACIFLATAGFTASKVAVPQLVNNAAPRHVRGRVNGVVMSVDAVAKCIGSYTGPVLFALLVGMYPRWGALLLFICGAIIQLLLFVGMLILPEDAERARAEDTPRGDEDALPTEEEVAPLTVPAVRPALRP